jgi:UDP-N-acetyl-alpha-D-muramoyl-L-alanyl-L-glutamate epimerase
MRRPDNFSTFHALREQFPYFSYDEYRYNFSGDNLEIAFFFSLSGRYFFTPRVRIPLKESFRQNFEHQASPELDNLVFHLGLIEMISYWKAACPPQIIIKPHALSAVQVGFWKKLFFNGLGEFFYMNSIETDEDSFVEVSLTGDEILQPFPMQPGGKLVPVGGGKDSAVTMGLLDRTGDDWMPFIINPGKATREVTGAAGVAESETIDFYREIDPGLLALNAQGFLNGHTPFSALLAFYSLLAALLTGRTEIILSNESSANEPTVPGTSINHQYSKSFEFEKDFRNYVSSFISPGFNYYSLLRPLSEIQIAKIFSGLPSFFPGFRSCNAGRKTGVWCGNCPKCLFTFIILSPFLKPAVLTSIFGNNLLDDPGLIEYFEELTGKSEIKPFECIGTVEEVNVALSRSAEMYDPSGLPYLLRVNREQKAANAKQETGFDQLLGHFDAANFVPEKYYNLLKRALG